MHAWDGTVVSLSPGGMQTHEETSQVQWHSHPWGSWYDVRMHIGEYKIIIIINHLLTCTVGCDVSARLFVLSLQVAATLTHIIRTRCRRCRERLQSSSNLACHLIFRSHHILSNEKFFFPQEHVALPSSRWRHRRSRIWKSQKDSTYVATCIHRPIYTHIENSLS